MAKKNELTGKFIIAFDTIVDGLQCATDDNGKPDPILFISEDEAMVELFGDALSMIENQSEKELKENSGITPEKREQMKTIFNEGAGDTKQMKNFLDANPECNYNEEFIVPAEEFVFGRKAIFGGEGLKIIGNKLS